MKDRLHKDSRLLPLSVAALGIVYGDIGTSPLYAMRESLLGLPIHAVNVLGILSLICWSLIILISIKYLSIVFRADNDGEGGILALLALLKRYSGKAYSIFFIVGIFGGGLMLGDGMLTPAISVLSAIEGLNTISSKFTYLVIPLSIIILLTLFFFQSRGTAKIGYLFGPIIFVWFIVIALLGLAQIYNNPIVLKALNPYYAFRFLQLNGWRGYELLGGVFLVMTGGEALYADLGHFGKTPIRLSWFLVALPCLLLNYFGQGAYLLSNPAAIDNPFYGTAPLWFSFPLLILATMATVIASQAVISGTFSLTKQAVLLGLYPHLQIKQTSETEKGQIYVPQINFILATGTLLLILAFKSSSALTHAYGIAVNLVMILTTLMIIYVARGMWQWSIFKIILVFSIFILFDFAFLGANSHKIVTGGWFPISFALFCGFIMFTWNKGMEYLRTSSYMNKEDLSKIIKQLNYKSLFHLPNVTGIFITDIYDKSGGSFFHFLKLSRVIPENILILNYKVGNRPYVPNNKRFEFISLGKNIYQLTLHYGFMDTIKIPNILTVADQLKIFPFALNADKATYFVEIPNINVSKTKKNFFFLWQKKVFAFLMRNYSLNLNIDFYYLPYNRTIAVGTYFII